MCREWVTFTFDYKFFTGKVKKWIGFRVKGGYSIKIKAAYSIQICRLLVFYAFSGFYPLVKRVFYHFYFAGVVGQVE